MADKDMYIKTMALALLGDGMAPTKALDEAKRMWLRRQENERIIDEMMKGDQS